jgi:hypothetical protein
VRQAEADSGRRRDLLTTNEREELKRLHKEKRRAPPRERDPEGRLRLFRDGARPDPAKVTRYVEERRDRKLSRRSTPPAPATDGCTACARTGGSCADGAWRVGRARVARLMRAEGLEGVRRGKKRRTRIPDEQVAERGRDLQQRDFPATRPGEKWVSDITYLLTWQGLW